MIERVINELKERRDRGLNGKVNCIPSPFERFRTDFVGIERGKYYIVSAATKGGKTQLTSYLFLFKTLEYAFDNPDKIRLKIFYFPLEESVEEIVERYMCYLLYHLSRGKIRISPTDLKSTNEHKLVPKEILDLLESEEYVSRLKFFEDHVEFSSERNPTGMWKLLSSYAKQQGKTVNKQIDWVNNVTGEISKKEVFDHYEPDDPEELVLTIWDHAALTSLERGMDLRESIMKLSEYFVILRNKYKYSTVLVMQQSTETNNLEAYKNKKIRPTVAGLGDSKYPGRDCNVMIGITNPYAFELPNYLGYNIQKLKENIRFIEIVINRGGICNSIVALYFDGAVTEFHELPKPDDIKELNKVYSFIEQRDLAEHNGICLLTDVTINHKFSNIFKKSSK